MKTVETENEGLKRAFMLTIPAEDIEARLDKEVKRIAPQVRMPGFRPGKVPPNLIRKMHGESLQRDALANAVQEGVQELLETQKVRPALQPQVELDEKYEPGKDAEVRVSLEALPDLPKPDIDGLTLERLTIAADEAQVDEQLKQIASATKRWTDAPKKHVAATGDQVIVDFVGRVGDTEFEGGTGTDMPIELGSGALIPGFEDQLVGAKAGDKREVKVTFPDDYPAENLKGKAAVFDVTVKAVKTAGENAINDELATSLGLKDLDQLRGLIRDQQGQELNALTRTHMKRQLLDQLANRHDFDVPQSMVDAEYQNILNQLRHEASHEADPKAALAEIESEASEYRKIAERRVRLGLLLSEIGAANNVQVSEQEMNRLIGQAASQYQGKERQRFLDYIQREPMAAAQLRAPLYEDKVVDFLFSKADVTERAATRAEVEADLESEEGHVHGPGCGHDHAAKPAKGKKANTKADTKPAPSKAGGPKPAKPVKDGAGAKAPEAKAKPAAKADAKPAKAEAKPAGKAEAKPAAKAAPAKKAPAKKK
ncbi:trigger factor [Sphingomonas lutea]|uniref:Trigger factor n=1 Tax=Sphingomonas lutea TaxID=1045317 RepID=A0A7G9SL43_9SPHN|nr:trigger factor [Sphingomonas lutea]QNN68568.1 trigger factor [Sphingomonas lutea]